MIGLGLKADQRQAYLRQLTATHQMRTTVRVLDLDGDTLANVSDRLLSGQVNLDSTGETDRQCSVQIDDPDHDLHMDSDAPGAGALYADRMLRVDYGVYVDELARWVDVPVFTGPIATMARNGDTVDLGCLGKEHLAKGQAWRPMQLRKGMYTLNAIKAVLRERAGETQFAFPSSSARLAKAKLPDTVSVGPLASPWAVARQLAASINGHLYYDGAGYCRLRVRPTTSCLTFNESKVLSDPQVTYDLSTIVNTVWVRGGKPKGAKRAVSARVTASRSHPLSAWRLGRNGVPRFYVTVVDNDKLRSATRARTVAKRTLRTHLLEGVSCTFDALPMPHLEPLDVVRVATDTTSITFVLHQASIPLTHDGSMSVGHNRRVTPRKKRIRG